MTESTSKDIVFKIQRYNPEQGGEAYWQEFNVAWSRGMTVLDGLIYVKEELDSTLAFRSSCRMGICGSCAMFINSYPRLACATQIEELHSETLTLKPLPNMSVIKDLVTDLTPLFRKHRSIKPYIIRYDTEEMENPTQEFNQKPRDMDQFLQFSYCITCGICVAACPTSASDRLYLGPQALAQCYRYCADNRDGGEEERLAEASAAHGVWHCHYANSCSEACPKGVDPALAIQLLKKRLASRTLGLGKKQQPCPPVSYPDETKPRVPVPEFTAE
ncbi:succinate dehydrogenase/fumarate reductase iron-sulfur subunit [Chloroflexota bacterium]